MSPDRAPRATEGSHKPVRLPLTCPRRGRPDYITLPPPTETVVFFPVCSTFVLFRGVIRITKCAMSVFDFEDTAGEISALTARQARWLRLRRSARTRSRPPVQYWRQRRRGVASGAHFLHRFADTAHADSFCNCLPGHRALVPARINLNP